MPQLHQSIKRHLIKAIKNDDHHTIELLLATNLITPHTILNSRTITETAFLQNKTRILETLARHPATHQTLHHPPTSEGAQHQLTRTSNNEILLRQTTFHPAARTSNYGMQFTAWNESVLATDAIACTAAADLSLVLGSDGTLVGWHSGFLPGSHVRHAEHHNGGSGLVFARNVKQFATQGYTALIVHEDGTLTVEHLVEVRDPTKAPSTPRKHQVREVHLGEYHSVTIFTNDQMYSEAGDYLMPNVRQVAVGKNHELILQHDGTVWASGDNRMGQTTGTDAITKKPIKVLEGIRMIAASPQQSFALTHEGELYAWGSINDPWKLLRNRIKNPTPTLIARNIKNIWSTSVRTFATHENGFHHPVNDLT